MNTHAPGEPGALLLNVDPPADPTWRAMAADPGETDGADGDGTDGTDGDESDGSDTDGTDGGDSDGTDGVQ